MIEGKRPSRFAHSEGRAGLIKAVVENSSVPVIETGTGNCHIYVDEFADLKKAAAIVYNAKTQKGIGLQCRRKPACSRGCRKGIFAHGKSPSRQKECGNKRMRKCAEILGDCVVPATEEDFAKEFLDYIISVKVVKILMRRFPTLQSIPPATAKAL